MTREQILSNLRTSLASSRSWLAGEAQAAPQDIPPYVLPPAEILADQFTAELRALTGRVYRVGDDEAAVEQIGAILAEKGASQVIAWDMAQIGLGGLPQLLAARGVALAEADVQGDARKGRLQAMEPAAVCISGAEAGIAESGSLMLRHGPGRPRLASLLAPYHVAVLRSSQIVRGLGEAIAQARARYGADVFSDTSNLTLITGPSRTADIEMTLALGIHGPQEIHVVLID
ncbi:lactate utilization protein [Oscillochloris sp. ZM17-4]|uniref:LutC/YkgG family protein n=1 Tax=Oscillochloris sp. ZM17-4 TaxID=2866714 RepID=UPI001C73D580|nr:lactate utilization protein [Oscillochloris sp. ZM17-4]MBX0327785.1 lactate utilization protein [Oscillochloris sp. ZM17-4]